jgi:hypothetical protein
MGKDGVKEWSRTLINIRDCAKPALHQLRPLLRFSLNSVSPGRASELGCVMAHFPNPLGLFAALFS